MKDRIENPWYPYPNAPDVARTLSAARELFNGLTVTALIGGGIGARSAIGLVRNLTRLLIQACEQYSLAVENHIEAVEDRSPNNLIYASTHWEGCIEALHRCMNIAEVFRQKLGQWAPQDPDMRIEKSARFADAETKPIRDIRHAVQHIENELLDYEAPDHGKVPGSGFFIHCGENGICFHGYEVSYQELAEYLERVAALCKWLGMQNPPPGHPLANPSRNNPINHVGSENYRRPFGGGDQ